jgi:hypothetical protein
MVKGHSKKVVIAIADSNLTFGIIIRFVSNPQNPNCEHTALKCSIGKFVVEEGLTTRRDDLCVYSARSLNSAGFHRTYSIYRVWLLDRVHKLS